jgi:hypothetical protein
MSKYLLFLVIVLDVVVLFMQIPHLSISYEEASLFYTQYSFLGYLLHLSVDIFGQTDFALRIVMICFHFLSVILIYLISKEYVSSDRNRLWLILVFILLPGIISSAIVVNSAGVIIFFLLLFIYLEKKAPQYILNILLFLYAFVDIHFIYLFIALSIYYLIKKNNILVFYMLFLSVLSVYLNGIDISGAPRGYFLDILGVYSAVFTPIIFIYLIYVLYRRYLTSKIDIVWFISSITFIVSLILSFRQRVAVEYFAPYLIVALPLAAQQFISSYRVRLKMYRTRYKIIFVLSFVFLLFNSLVVFFNKELYLVIKNPKKHFAYNMHVAKELAYQLKQKDIDCVLTDEKMQKRLKFYKISKCSKYILRENKLTSQKPSNVTVSYKNKIIYKADVTNINNL